MRRAAGQQSATRHRTAPHLRRHEFSSAMMRNGDGTGRFWLAASHAEDRPAKSPPLAGARVEHTIDVEWMAVAETDRPATSPSVDVEWMGVASTVLVLGSCCSWSGFQNS